MSLRFGLRRRARLVHPPRRLAALVLAGIAAGGCGTGGSPEVAYVVPVREYDMPSGLRVAIEQVDSAATIGVAWVVDSGQVDDPPGAPGLAHLIEHLALRAPNADGVPLASRLANLGAAGTNGITGLDRTTFCTFAPRSTLEEVVDAVAERLADPLRGVDEALLAKEQMVIHEELALRHGIASSTGLGLVLAALVPPGHPLVHTRDEAADASREHVSLEIARAFVARHYRPERMTLVLSGAIPPEIGRRILGALPTAFVGRAAAPVAAIRRPLAKADLVPNPTVGLQPRAVDVTTPELWMAWLLPPVRGTETIEFEVLGGVVARTLANLVDDGFLPDVLAVGVANHNSTVGGFLIARLVLRPSADAGLIQRRVAESVSALAGLDYRFPGRALITYDKVLRATVLPTALGMESIARRTMLRANLLHEDAGTSLATVMDHLEAITPSIVADLANRYLREEQARAVLLVPDGPRVNARTVSISASRSPRSTDTTAPLDGDENGADPSDEDDDRAAQGDLLAVARAPGVSAALTTRLPNGLTVIALRRPGLPFASMVLGFHADPQPGESPAARQAVLYARTHQFVEGPLERGLLQQVSHDDDSYWEALSMFAANVGQAFDLLDDESRSLSVRWPSKAFERWMETATLAVGTPAERANSAFTSALWGSNLYALRLTKEMAGKLTADQIHAWLDRVRRPGNGALVIVGDVDPRVMARTAADRLGDWQGDPTPPPAPPAAPLAAHGPDLPVVLAEDPHRQSTDVHFGCFLPPVRSTKDAVAGGVFREMLENELFRRLRLELGISYAPHVRATSLRGGTLVVDGHIDVGQAELPRALRILRGWLDTRGPLPEAQAFERARWRVARRSGLGFSTNAALARSIFDAWNLGLPPESLDQFPHNLAGLTPADMTAALTACRASAVVSVIGQGPLPAALE